MENNLSALSQSLAALVERVAASTVGVLTSRRGQGAASGVVWRDGVIVTAAHRFRRAPSAITVVLADRSSAEAAAAGSDPSTDIAVFRLTGAGVATANLGDAQSVRAGHLVTAVGRSAEGDAIASHGMVNCAGGPWQTWLGGQLDRLIRLDGGVYDSLAGGAVADSSGQVIGIATPALSRSHGIVVPASTVSRVVDALLAKGRIARAYLGIGAQPVPLPKQNDETGLLITALAPQGPAEQAGLLVGDIIVEVAGERAASLHELRASLATRVGEPVRVSLLRGGAPLDVSLTVGEWPAGRSCC